MLALLGGVGEGALAAGGGVGGGARVGRGQLAEDEEFDEEDDQEGDGELAEEEALGEGEAALGLVGVAGFGWVWGVGGLRGGLRGRWEV